MTYWADTAYAIEIDCPNSWRLTITGENADLGLPENIAALDLVTITRVKGGNSAPVSQKTINANYLNRIVIYVRSEYDRIPALDTHDRSPAHNLIALLSQRISWIDPYRSRQDLDLRQTINDMTPEQAAEARSRLYTYNRRLAHDILDLLLKGKATVPGDTDWLPHTSREALSLLRDGHGDWLDYTPLGDALAFRATGQSNPSPAPATMEQQYAPILQVLKDAAIPAFVKDLGGGYNVIHIPCDGWDLNIGSIDGELPPEYRTVSGLDVCRQTGSGSTLVSEKVIPRYDLRGVVAYVRSELDRVPTF
ncbi:hypothetical protein DQ384_36485 [Sphaerisporangium album]|uniref:Uncharacterized protein n=1 Tax=Sphaerisporangium album TaxID=509200 RepID=A0A367ESM2_9ACTN|nr:hypothetical protein [Sphaerisporangium album]RCG21116.1 hypothetical protein DQ384_36485 [Sphaerisporangium album]